VVSDVDAGTVRFIADERKEASLDAYFDTVPATELARIEAVAMDMWEPYANSVRGPPRGGRLQDRLRPVMKNSP
jgi:transposase